MPPPRSSLPTDPPPAFIPLEELVRAILDREKLAMHDLPRCRREVLLQLAHASPWSEATEHEVGSIATALDHPSPK